MSTLSSMKKTESHSSHVKSHMSRVVTRFAPSPTGVLHVGSARTALFNYLYARKHGGKFIVRIEDTDKERSKKEFEDNIIAGLTWLGLQYDELYHQRDRGPVYRRYISALIENNFAYIAEEERGTVIRFRNKGEEITFNDVIRGDITFNTAELGDFVIARDAENPLYHLAVVIDDHEMGVTHVIRGEDHISNTPRQILLQDAIGAARPVYAHIPLILAPDKSKLSKRHGARGIDEYEKEGYLPEALVNFLALLGWSPQEAGSAEASEVLTLEELVRLFTLEKIQKGGAVFDIGKLRWMNREHIKRLPIESVLEHVKRFMPEELWKGANESVFKALVPLIIERLEIFSDVSKMHADGELSCFFGKPTYNPAQLPWKSDDAEKTRRHIIESVGILEKIEKSEFTERTIKEALLPYADKEGRGSVLWPVRYALSGREKSPDPFTIASILGKEETIARLSYAANFLS